MVGEAFQDDGELTEALGRAREADEFQEFLPTRSVQELPPIPDFVGTIIKVLGYALLAALVVVLIFAIVQFARSWRLKKIEAAKKKSGKSVPRIRAEDLSVDHEAVQALVAEGKFSEAIHLLLLQTLHSLGRALKLKLDPSWTSREILGRIELPEEAHDSLRALVQSVELSHFGGVEATKADFDACWSRYENFLSLISGKAS